MRPLEKSSNEASSDSYKQTSGSIGVTKESEAFASRNFNVDRTAACMQVEEELIEAIEETTSERGVRDPFEIPHRSHDTFCSANRLSSTTDFPRDDKLACATQGVERGSRFVNSFSRMLLMADMSIVFESHISISRA